MCYWLVIIDCKNARCFTKYNGIYWHLIFQIIYIILLNKLNISAVYACCLSFHYYQLLLLSRSKMWTEKYKFRIITGYCYYYKESIVKGFSRRVSVQYSPYMWCEGCVFSLYSTGVGGGWSACPGVTTAYYCPDALTWTSPVCVCVCVCHTEKLWPRAQDHVYLYMWVLVWWCSMDIEA